MKHPFAGFGEGMSRHRGYELFAGKTYGHADFAERAGFDDAEVVTRQKCELLDAVVKAAKRVRITFVTGQTVEGSLVDTALTNSYVVSESQESVDADAVESVEIL
ncbi:hypothetical protein EBS80_00950 [bacterium]|nr:hypothetical protein [bacterium]